MDRIYQAQPAKPTFNLAAWQARAIYIGRRLLFILFVLFAIVFLSFSGLEMARGTGFWQAVALAAGRSLGYAGRLLRGELGLTTAGSDLIVPLPVTQVILERLPRSLGLLAVSLAGASLVGVWLGILAGARRSGRSLRILLASIIGISLPSFFAAFLLQWLATAYTRAAGKPLLPVGGFGWDAHLILPAIVLAARPLAQITRITYVTVGQALEQDYVRTARSKGLRRYQIMGRHVLRNVAIPVLTTIGLSLRFSLSSLPVVEFYFGWPGAGTTLLSAIAKQDDNLTVALVLCLGALFMLVNLLLDLSYRLIDPRVGLAQEERSESRSLRAWLKTGWQTLAATARRNGWRSGWKRPRAGTTLPPLPVRLQQEMEALPARSHKGRLAPSWASLPLVLGGLLVLGLAVLTLWGPNLAPINPFTTHGLSLVNGQFVVPPFTPDEVYRWGSDALGRDLFSLILAGAQQTMLLAVLVVAVRLGAGILLGAMAGWNSGSRLDRLIMGSAEVLSAFPTLLLAMIFILALGIRQGLRPFILALGFVGWGETMQFVRGQVIALKPKPFIEGAIAAGAGVPRIIHRHILPNLFGALISLAALEMGAVLMLLGELGFIGIFIGGGSFAELEIDAAPYHYSDVPEWAALLSSIRTYARAYPWTGLYPALAFFVAILSFNLFGEGLRRLVHSGSLILNRLFNRYTLLAAVLLVVTVNWSQSQSGPNVFYRRQARAFSGEKALEQATLLTDPALQGRALGTPGQRAAAEAIAAEFEALGLQPAGENLTYFQEKARAFEQLSRVPTLAIDDGLPAPVYGRDFAAYPGYYLTQGTVRGPIRFVGLGAPVSGGSFGLLTRYPELRTADFGQELLLVLNDEDARTLANTPHGGMLVVVDDPGAVARLVTLSGRSAVRLNLFSGAKEGQDTPSLWITPELADRLLASAGLSLAEARQGARQLATGEVWQEELGLDAGIQVEARLEERYPVLNVIGHLPGTAAFANEGQLDQRLIVVLAQYDSPPPGPEGAFYAAANNNASGVAVMLEAIRVLQQTEYQPYKTFLFVAYSGEGLEGGESVAVPDVSRFLQAKAGFATSFELEAIIHLRGLGAGSGDRPQVSAGGSLRLAELFERAGRQMGIKVGRANEAIDISIVYSDLSRFDSAQEAPELFLSWQGWAENAGTVNDNLATLSAGKLEDAGRTLAMALMILGRETRY